MDGFLLIDKPRGLTSHDVIDRVRNVLKNSSICKNSSFRRPDEKVGHAGTLDPLATGLLIVGIGAATKQLGDLTGLDKTYEAELTLGAVSDTYDAEGIITPTAPPCIPPLRGGSGSDIPPHGGEKKWGADIDSIIKKYTGSFDQRAPLFSAKKIHGKKLYDLARNGTATEEMRPVKRITIDRLLVTGYAYPRLTLTVDCSSGTYIRSLADDIGRDLETGAYLSALRRTTIGDFDVKDAIKIDGLTNETIRTHLLSLNRKKEEK